MSQSRKREAKRLKSKEEEEEVKLPITEDDWEEEEDKGDEAMTVSRLREAGGEGSVCDAVATIKEKHTEVMESG